MALAAGVLLIGAAVVGIVLAGSLGVGAAQAAIPTGPGGGGGTTAQPPASSGPVEKQIAAAAGALGFNKVAIAGLIGNATQESSLNPSIDVSGCRGLFCWNPGANPQAELVKVGDVAQQVWLAARALGPSGIAAMNNAGSPEAATVYFEQNFERAGIPNMQNRIDAANAAYQAGF